MPFSFFVILYFLLNPLALITMSQFQVKQGIATIYYIGDGYSGLERADGKEFTEYDDHIAHRNLPIGTVGLLCSKKTELCAITSVRDSGPFGQIKRCWKEKNPPEDSKIIRWKKKCNYWVARTRLIPGWKWRGEFDLTRLAAKKIKLKAFDEVTFFYISPKRN